MYTEKTANSSISTTPLQFGDVPTRNAFEYLARSNLYCQKIEPLTYITAAWSVDLCLLLFAQLFSKFKRSESRNADRKQILTWNSHSRSFNVIHFATNHRPTKGSISPYDIAGLISEVSEEIAA